MHVKIPFSRLRRLLDNERVLVCLASLAFGAIFSYPLLRDHNLSKLSIFGDWDFSLQLGWVPYKTIVQFHQIPLWNPYKCGGMPMLGNPQSHFVTPLFLLSLLFGPVVGLHLEVPVHMAIAWSGTYTLARVQKIAPLAAAGAAVAYAGSSWFNLHACEGHVIFLALAYMPWCVALAWLGSEPGRIAYAVASGAVLALSFLEGSPYIPVYVALMMALVMLPLAVMRRSLRPVFALIAAGFFAAGIGAIKLLPAYLVLKAHPRVTDAAESNSWYAIFEALFSFDQRRLRPSPNLWGFHELGAYIGLFAIPAVIGLLSPRRAIPWIVAACATLIIVRGQQSPTSLYVYLHQLPVFSDMRLPSRMLICFVLAIAMMAGLGLDVLCKSWREHGAGIATTIVMAATVTNFIIVTPNLNHITDSLIMPDSPVPAFRQFLLNGWGVSTFQKTLENVGVIHCYEYTQPVQWTSGAVGYDEHGYRGEQYMDGPGSVRVVRWTPNALTFEVNAPAPTVLVINQNYHPSWRLRSGQGDVVSRGGLLAVKLPAGRQEVSVQYVETPFLTGAAITLLFVVTALLIIRKQIWLRSYPKPKS
jgi:hypothetical protein